MNNAPVHWRETTNQKVMSKKTFNYVSALITSVSAVAVASVSYFCDAATAATVNGVISAVSGLAITICSKFVKDEPEASK